MPAGVVRSTMVKVATLPPAIDEGKLSGIHRLDDTIHQMDSLWSLYIELTRFHCTEMVIRVIELTINALHN